MYSHNIETELDESENRPSLWQLYVGSKVQHLSTIQ